MTLKYEYSVVSGRFPTKQKAEDAISYILDQFYTVTKHDLHLDKDGSEWVVTLDNEDRLQPSLSFTTLDSYREQLENFLYPFGDDDNGLSHTSGEIRKLAVYIHSVLTFDIDKEAEDDEIENEIGEKVEKLVKLSDDLYEKEEKEITKYLKKVSDKVITESYHLNSGLTFRDFLNR